MSRRRPTMPRRRPLAVAAVTVALLAGCAVGPDYQRPDVALPAQFPHASESNAPLRADWWQAYGSAELTRLVERALTANADIAQAVARVEFAEAQLREAGGALVPTVNLGANAGRSELGAGVPGNTAGVTVRGNDYRLALNTSFEIDFWGRLRRANEAARARLLASAAARDTVRLSIAGAVAQSWLALRSLDDQIAATRDTLATREAGVRLFGARLQAGVGSRLEVEQAEGLRADAAVLLRELQRQRDLTLSTLAVLTADPGLTLPEAGLGGPVGSDAAVAQPMAAALPASAARPTAAVQPLQPPFPPPGLPSDLLVRRPDVRAAEEQLVAANALVGVARAAMFPQVSLTGALGQESGALRNLLESPARFWSLGFGLSLPLFDGGRNAARVDQAGAQQREAVAAYQGAVAGAFRDVADALANARAAREVAGDVLRRDAAGAAALRLAQARFDAGYAGYLELLDAQRSATAARLEVVRNRQAQLAASVDLAKALGGGWEEAPLR